MDSQTKKQIYNQKYADQNPERMKRNSSINYGLNRDKILLASAHYRYLNGATLRVDTIQKLVDAGFDVIHTKKPKYVIAKGI